jgi:hypothetical protein
MPAKGTPQWQKSNHTSGYLGSTAKTTNYKNLKMHTNMDGLNKLKSDLINLSLNHIRYGIVDQVTYPTGDPNGRAGMMVAEIWKRLEFGFAFVTPTGGRAVIPPRPIFAVHLNTTGAADFKKFSHKVAVELFSGRYARDTALNKLGLLMQSSLKSTIETYKGFAPLVLPAKSPRSPYDFYDDTGYLKEQISFRVMPTSLQGGE